MYAFFAQLFDPYTLVFLVTGGMVANLWRRRRETGRVLLFLTVPFVLLMLLSMRWVADLAQATVARQYATLADRPRDVSAIVVLGGGVLGVDETHPRAVLAPDSLFRCLTALEVYRDGPHCPIVVCGGVVEADVVAPPVAKLMREALILAGVTAEDIIVEDRSTTTYENALECRRVLSERGWSQVVLVTEARHMPRAVRCFQAQGVDVIPIPCDPRGTGYELKVVSFLPTSGAACDISAVCHEWLGIAWYRLFGRL